MRLFKNMALLAMVIGVIFCVSIWAADTLGSFKITVKDTDGNPIEGAKITLMSRDTPNLIIQLVTDKNGVACKDSLKPDLYNLTIVKEGFPKKEGKVKLRPGLTVTLEEMLLTETQAQAQAQSQAVYGMSGNTKSRMSTAPQQPYYPFEDYDGVEGNKYKNVLETPLSTFSIDVDTASYAIARRYLNDNTAPPKESVRVEEYINYFNFDYPQPEKDENAFSVSYEVSQCPWDNSHRLVHIGIQGRNIDMRESPPGNYVFLIDVSGSMGSHDKLPLLKKGFKLLVNALDEKDKVAIVTYSGHVSLALPPTPGSDKEAIISALNGLNAGGSTAGGAGLMLAYDTARENYIEGGINRVILATDGDFNVGVSSDEEMVKLIEEKRKTGVFLSTLGFGTGNIKDSKMEKLADHGNGNYSYIDSLLEAQKVLVREMGGTFMTIAKDVKLQVEFNPTKVKSYRLIGYENRVLEAEDFADDTKDAGELGAGHSVTALYEIVPGSAEPKPGDKTTYRYQSHIMSENASVGNELFNLKLRYKEPDGDTSRLIEMPLVDQAVTLKDTSDNYRFSAAVALFGMLLRDSEFSGNGTYQMVLDLARGSKGDDAYGYRAEFIKLAEKTMLMNQVH